MSAQENVVEQLKVRFEGGREVMERWGRKVAGLGAGAGAASGR